MSKRTMTIKNSEAYRNMNNTSFMILFTIRKYFIGCVVIHEFQIYLKEKLKNPKLEKVFIPGLVPLLHLLDAVHDECPCNDGSASSRPVRGAAGSQFPREDVRRDRPRGQFLGAKIGPLHANADPELPRNHRLRRDFSRSYRHLHAFHVGFRES